MVNFFVVFVSWWDNLLKAHFKLNNTLRASKRKTALKDESRFKISGVLLLMLYTVGSGFVQVPPSSSLHLPAGFLF